MSRLALPLFALAFAACNSAPFSPPHADAGAFPDGSGSQTDASQTPNLDLSTSIDALPPTEDMAWNPSVPHPPMDATVCAKGTFGVGDSQKVCMAPSLILDNWGMAQQPFPRDCGAVTFDAGDWQVWCDVTTAYVFVHFANLTPTGTLTCKGLAALDLSAVYEAGNGGGDTGANLQDGYGNLPEGFFDENRPVDAYAWITVDKKAQGATIWIAPFSELLDPSCGAPNSGGRTVAGGASVSWK